MIKLPQNPRDIDPAQTFAALVASTAALIEEKRVPGFIMGLSGTDSVLAFLICVKAFEALGRPDRVIGVHYSEGPDSWFAQKLIPWLQGQAAGASIIVDTKIDSHKDGLRWGDLYDRSVLDIEMGCQLPTGGNYWIVAATNATEAMLGTYSNASMGASFHPIEQLWKSEVLKLCTHLAVPEIAISMSRQAHVICGRCHFLAGNIDEIDEVLMVKSGQLDATYLKDAFGEAELQRLEEFVNHQMQTAAFKKLIPYALPPSIVPVSPTTALRDQLAYVSPQNADARPDTP